MMYEYDEECLKTFLKNQSQLFDEPVDEAFRMNQKRVCGAKGINSNQQETSRVYGGRTELF